MNIYDFINDPSKAVYAGYRPSYLTCVSCVANNWWAFCRWTAGRVGRFKYVLDMTLGGGLSKPSIHWFLDWRL